MNSNNLSLFFEPTETPAVGKQHGYSHRPLGGGIAWKEVWPQKKTKNIMNKKAG